MQWVIPTGPQSRELSDGYRLRGISTHHVLGPSEFYRNCGADLRVTRLWVRTVSYGDVWRHHISWIASGFSSGRRSDEEELERLEISPADQHKMEKLINEGSYIFMYPECGLYHVAFVGITADGMFLYATLGEYQIGPQTQLRYEGRDYLRALKRYWPRVNLRSLVSRKKVEC